MGGWRRREGTWGGGGVVSTVTASDSERVLHHAMLCLLCHMHARCCDLRAIELTVMVRHPQKRVLYDPKYCAPEPPPGSGSKGQPRASKRLILASHVPEVSREEDEVGGRRYRRGVA